MLISGVQAAAEFIKWNCMAPDCCWLTKQQQWQVVT
jgi:hypothetical protein